MLKKYSHFPDLQATDKYKIYSTKATTYAGLTGHALPLQLGGGGGIKISEKCLHQGGIRNFYFGGGGLYCWGVILLGRSHNFGVKIKTA